MRLAESEFTLIFFFSIHQSASDLASGSRFTAVVYHWLGHGTGIACTLGQAAHRSAGQSISRLAGSGANAVLIPVGS